MYLTRHWHIVACAPPLTSYQHITPCNDTIDHVPTVHCPCGPVKSLHHDGPHVIAVQFLHNAIDGRLR